MLNNLVGHLNQDLIVVKFIDKYNFGEDSYDVPVVKNSAVYFVFLLVVIKLLSMI